MQNRQHFIVVMLSTLMTLYACTNTGEKKPKRETIVSVKTIKVSSNSHVVGKNYMGTVEEEDGAMCRLALLATL